MAIGLLQRHGWNILYPRHQMDFIDSFSCFVCNFYCLLSLWSIVTMTVYVYPLYVFIDMRINNKIHFELNWIPTQTHSIHTGVWNLPRNFHLYLIFIELSPDSFIHCEEGIAVGSKMIEYTTSTAGLTTVQKNGAWKKRSDCIWRQQPPISGPWKCIWRFQLIIRQLYKQYKKRLFIKYLTQLGDGEG